jgi:hypothetical protein
MKRHFRALGVPLFLLLTVVLEVFVMEGTALCQASQRDLDALSKASVIYIATVRKDGNQSKAAPVWFTFTPDGLIYIQTRPDRWKAKRVKRAEITSDPAVVHRITDDFPHRYLMVRLGWHVPKQAMFDKGDVVAIKITPVHDLPEGFASKPGTPAPSLDAHAANSPG